MAETLSAANPSVGWLAQVSARVRGDSPSLVEWVAGLGSAVLLILAFPNFGFSALAWVGLVPLLTVISLRPSPLRAFILGWATGSVFYYCTCYWLTYSMIHYGGLNPMLAYLLLVPGALVVGLFPGLFALLTALAIRRWGYFAVVITPFIWAASEWIRLGVTGQLWNALGYSQAYHPFLIQTAVWGGVYAVSFLIATVNAAVVLHVVGKTGRTLLISLSLIFLVGALISFTFLSSLKSSNSGTRGYVNIVAVQPNVPMSPTKTTAETNELLERHLAISTNGLQQFGSDDLPRLVIWPESPMNFTYGSDSTLRDLVSRFAREKRTSILLNSLEAAPDNGGYNSALLINEEGRLIAQYDKIRLMPFGEYVPLPQWLGGSLISGIVGEFTPGDRYALMPIAKHQAGVFICIESAYPYIPRNLTTAGADVLINISNDGYLGPTAVMRQHLANAVFRAVENGRPLLRVTNSGITAYVSASGVVRGETAGFTSDGRIWSVSQANNRNTFYTRYGDVFVQLCAAITITVFVASVYTRRSSRDLR